MTIDLAAAVEQQQSDAARHADIERRDAEHGGMVSIPQMVAEQQRKEAARDWRAYRVDVRRAEVTAVEHDATLDIGRIEVRRLLADCRAAVKRFSRLHRFGGLKNAETAADILATDAAMILIRRPSNGGGIDPKTGKRSALLDLGGIGGLPLHRDWLDSELDPGRGRRWTLSSRAWAALLSAVKEAAAAPAIRALAEQDANEEPTDPVDVSAAVEQHQRETDAAVRLPDNQAPEVVAATMDIPLDAARAIVHRAYPTATLRDLSESWRLSVKSLEVALSRGGRILRDRFSDPATLLDALDVAAAIYRAEVAAEVAPALLAYREDPSTEHATAAEVAAADWRAVYGAPSMERRALDVAAMQRKQRAHRIAARLQRSGQIATWQGLDAERVSASVSRILRAEQRRARQSATAARSSHMGGRTLPMAEERACSAPVQRQQRSDRIWTYGLAARSDREQRTGAARVISRNGRAV